VQQVAIAWALALSPAIIPIPSARRIETLRDSLGAAGLILTREEMQLLQPDLTTD